MVIYKSFIKNQSNLIVNDIIYRMDVIISVMDLFFVLDQIKSFSLRDP